MSEYLSSWGFIGFAGNPPEHINLIDYSFETKVLDQISYDFSDAVFPESQMKYVCSAQTFPCDVRLAQSLRSAGWYLWWDIGWEWLNEVLLQNAARPAEWNEAAQPPANSLPSEDYPPDWKERYTAVRKRDRNRCCACGNRIGMKGIEVGSVHHITGKQIAGHRMENLVCMCDACHDIMPGHEVRHSQGIVVADDYNHFIHLSTCAYANQPGMRTLDKDWPKGYKYCQICVPQRNAEREKKRRYQQAAMQRFPIIREHLAKFLDSCPPSPALGQKALDSVPRIDVFRLKPAAIASGYINQQSVEILGSNGPWEELAYPTPGSVRDMVLFAPKPRYGKGIGEMAEFNHGTIKHFNPEKAFGHIETEQYGDVRFWMRNVTNASEKEIKPGARVLFDFQQQDDGRFTAVNVKILGNLPV